MSEYEREKPDTKRVVEQGYGYAVVYHVQDFPPMKAEGDIDVSDTPKVDYDLGYIRATVEKSEDGLIGVYELDGEKHRIAISKLRPRKPCNVGILI